MRQYFQIVNILVQRSFSFSDPGSSSLDWEEQQLAVCLGVEVVETAVSSLSWHHLVLEIVV